MLLQPNHNKFGLYKEKAGLKLLPPQEGLICNLDMENIAGTTVYDRTGNGNNGVMTNVTVTNGTKGLNDATNYNGTNAILNSSLSLFDYSAWTIECWFALNTLPVSHNIIFSDGTLATGNNRLFLFGCQSSDPELKIMTFMPSELDLTTGVDAAAGQWYHVIITYNNSTTTTEIYIDGDKKNSSSSYPMVQTPSVKGFRLGAFRLSGGSFSYYNNKISSFRFWNRILSDKEVIYLYNNGYGLK